MIQEYDTKHAAMRATSIAQPAYTSLFCRKRKVSQSIKTMRIYTENPDKTRFWRNNLFFSFYYVIFSYGNFGLQTFFLYLQIS